MNSYLSSFKLLIRKKLLVVLYCNSILEHETEIDFKGRIRFCYRYFLLCCLAFQLLCMINERDPVVKCAKGDKCWETEYYEKGVLSLWVMRYDKWSFKFVSKIQTKMLLDVLKHALSLKSIIFKCLGAESILQRNK